MNNVATKAEPPADSWDDEKVRLDSLKRADPETALIVSDLHLSAGQDPATQAWHWMENFTADGAFARWLASEAKAASDGSILILNGDIFDFVRVMGVPQSEPDFELWREVLEGVGKPPPQDVENLIADRGGISRNERRHGFGTEEARSLWKFAVIHRGHTQFFGALTDWVARGGWLLIMVGNHDVEYHWPFVRKSIRQAIAGNRDDVPTEHIVFERGPLLLRNLFIEHGHNHERLTRVDACPFLTGGDCERPDLIAGNELRLPLGSFINRYYINHLERLDPHIDNVKPPGRSLLSLLRRRPLACLEIVWRSVKFSRRAFMVRGWHAKALGGVACVLWLVALAAPTLAVLNVFAPIRRWTVVAVAALESWWALLFGAIAVPFLPALLPFLWGVVSGVWFWLKRGWHVLRPPQGLQLSREHRSLRQAVEDALPKRESQKIRYAIVGHTHTQGVHRLDADGSLLAVNTGTWIGNWPEHRPDILGHTQYVFARFDRAEDGDYTHSLLQWTEAGQVRPASFRERELIT